MIDVFMEQGICVARCDSTEDVDTRKVPRPHAGNLQHMLYHNAKAQRAWHNDSFFGGTSEDTIRVLEQGWPEGQAMVTELADTMRDTLPPPVSYRRKQIWSQDGDEPSWEREMHGADDIWRTSRRATMRGPSTVELIAPWSHSGMYGASDIKWNGVVLAVLIDLLEESGYRVGATLAKTNTLGMYGAKFLGLIPVKRPEHPLDMASLVPIVVHPGVYRWHGVNLVTLHPTTDCTSGMGTPIDLPSITTGRDFAGILPPKYTLLSRCYSEQAARNEIMRVLGMFGAEQPAPIAPPTLNY